MSVTARFDITINQGLVLAQMFAPKYLDTDTDTLVAVDYTGYSATFTIFPAPATLQSLHEFDPIFETTDASGAIQLGLFEDETFGEYGILLYLTQGITSAMEPWGVGVYNLDIIDEFGHPQVRFEGAIKLQEGRKHD